MANDVVAVRAVESATGRPEPAPARGAPARARAGRGEGGEEAARADVLVEISPEARALLGERDKAAGASSKQRAGAGVEPELSDEEEAVVRELQKRDTEVRAHEGAHAAVAGALGGAPQFTYQTGPDGRRYAVGGEVAIQISEGRTPEETIANAQQVRAAALAPADPSPQDRAVAAAATRLEQQARQQEQAQKIEADRARREEQTEEVRERPPGETRSPEAQALDLFTRLDNDRATAFGPYAHPHQQAECGFCRRAVAAYS